MLVLRKATGHAYGTPELVFSRQSPRLGGSLLSFSSSASFDEDPPTTTLLSTRRFASVAVGKSRGFAQKLLALDTIPIYS
jgi:hypothetical protein